MTSLSLLAGWTVFAEISMVYDRIKMAKFKLERPDKKVGIYKALPHGQDKMNQLNENR